MSAKSFPRMQEERRSSDLEHPNRRRDLEKLNRPGALKGEIREDTDELLRRVASLRDPERSMVARSIIEAVQGIAGEQPPGPRQLEPGSRSFVAFGLLLLVVGVPVFVILPAIGIIFGLAGVAILGLSFVNSWFRIGSEL